MFNSLLADLKLFVEERNWTRFHSPQNMATTLLVEATELLEHFLPNAPKEQTELENELGDLLHCILLTMDALNLSPPAQNIEYQGSGNHILDLSIKLRTFMSHFLWLRESEPFRGEIEDLALVLQELLAIHFLICKDLNIDPFKVTYTKLELNRKKYPASLMKDSVDSYFARKKELQKKQS